MDEKLCPGIQPPPLPLEIFTPPSFRESLYLLTTNKGISNQSTQHINCIASKVYTR